MAIVPRSSFTAIRERFWHIDATFVEAVCRLGATGSETSKLVVRFYPGGSTRCSSRRRSEARLGRFRDTITGARDVTVYPIGLRAFRLRSRLEVTDWLFADQHPLLWPYEAGAEIFCNGPLDVEALIERVQGRVPPLCRDAIATLVGAGRPNPPFCLGAFPASMFSIVYDELAVMGVPVFVPARPEARPTPTVLLLDDDDDGDFLIADDFEVDVPEWEHRDEWFGAPSS